MNALNRELQEIFYEDPYDWENILHLISEGADPNLVDEKFSTPLHYASYSNNDRAIKLLLNDDRTNPNIRNGEEMTPLGIAVKYNFPTIVRLLLKDPRVDPNSKNGKKKNTPLMLAIKEAEQTYDDRMIKTLLADKRVNINEQNRDGQTALVLAYDLGNSHKEILELLLNDPRIDITKGTEYELEEIEAMYPEYFKLLRLQNELRKIGEKQIMQERSPIMDELSTMINKLIKHVDIHDRASILDRIEAIEMLLPEIS